MTTSFVIQEVAIPGTNMTVAFVFIDTIILAGNLTQRTCTLPHMAQTPSRHQMMSGHGLIRRWQNISNLVPEWAGYSWLDTIQVYIYIMH